MPATTDHASVARGLDAAYARQRLQEVIRGIAEDALSPSYTETLPWRDESLFEDELRLVVAEITEATSILLVRRLTDLVDSAPPQLVGRLVSAPRHPDLA